jgi:hypothetical protein
MTRVSFLLLISLLATTEISAQGIPVAFLDGDVARQAGADWVAVKIGDRVATDATVRLGTRGFLQLSATDGTITLSQPGIYHMSTILASSRRSTSGRAPGLLTRAFAALAGGGASNKNTASGARGADQSKSDDSGFFSSSAAVFLGAGKDYIASGDYVAAIDQLQQARDSATDSEAPEVQYYLAVAEASSGKVRDAFNILSSLVPTGTESWTLDFYLLKARLLLDTFAPQAAVSLLTGPGASASGDSQRAPVYYFLLTLAYQALGEAGNAQRASQRLGEIAGDSDLARMARDVVKTP